MDPTPSEQAVDAVKTAAEAIEISRAEQIEQAIRPIYERLDRQDEAFENHRQEWLETVKTLATTEDLAKKFKKLDNFVEGFNTTVKVGEVIGKFGFKTITIIAALIVAIGVLSGGFKALIAGIAAWALGAK